MKQFIKKVKQISILLLAISFIGCDENEELLPEVISSFTYTIDADTGDVTFINTSVNSRNYFWTFGDGTSSTLMNPIKTYTAGEYIVTLKATNVAGASDISEAIIVISDVGAPVITLLGDTTMNIMIGGTFTDPGATAMDDVDGDITANIVVAGDVVDVNTAGTYIITYNVSDSAGNAATERTRTVIVAADTVAPVITLLGDATMNLMVGDTFTDPGATATDDVDGDITDDIVVAGDAVDVNTAGTYTITYNVSDAAGNAADEVTRTVTVTDPNACTPETSESMSASNLNVTFMTDQSANIISDGAGFEWVDNPNANNTVNSSCKVGKINKSGQFPWDNNQIDLDGKLDFDTNSGLKIKVYSAVAGFTVRIKLEEIGNAGNNTELEVATTKTNEWEELSFPFASDKSNKFNKIVIFFDLNANNTDTYYFDDLTLYGDGGGVIPPPSDCPAPPAGELLSNGDFEAGDVCWQFFEGALLSTTVNNTIGGSNSGELPGKPGPSVHLKMERFGVGVVQPNTSYTVTFDIISSGDFGEGGIFKAFAFSEGADGGTVGATLHTLTDSTTSLSTSWETKTYTFTTAANANQVEGGISLLFEIVNSTNSAILNIDNVVVKKTP
ncbi:PKD repeat-containing protein [Lutibacter agarilyticus]|uniref:PKD repeat-containing protein n=1 Tax=Lutibacter agarilyticus TaxID=1109740 RepID=A0A238Y1I7_9FLAO|nr:immunoglobulin-like domain-containing protein [Lutibacter agarilyticus]SNR64149.1 PKD repeat-containing protein [Lutibacter agarilyticus]